MLQQQFALEKKCADLKDQYRKEYLQNKELPFLEEYFCWVNTLDPEKGSKLAETVTYAKNQREALSAFLTNSNVPISNNLAENAIRPFAVGRKNWLFCDTVMGAQSSAIICSLVETAKANSIEPFQDLRYILTELPYIGKSPAHADLDLPLP